MANMLDSVCFTEIVGAGAAASASDAVAFSDSLTLCTPTAIAYQTAAIGGNIYPSAPPAPWSNGWAAAPLLIDAVAGDEGSGYAASGDAPVLWVLASFPIPSLPLAIELAGQFGASGATASAYASSNGSEWSPVGWLSGTTAYRDLTLTGSEAAWFPVNVSVPVRSIAICLRAARTSVLTLTDVRFNSAADGSGLDLTPGMIRWADSVRGADGSGMSLVRREIDVLGFADAGRPLRGGGHTLGTAHPDQVLGQDEAFATRCAVLARTLAEGLSLSASGSIGKQVSVVDVLSLRDGAGLRAVLRPLVEGLALGDTGAALPGLRERIGLSDAAGAEVSPHLVDGMALADLARSGILKGLTDALVGADAALLALAIGRASEALAGLDAADVTGPRTDSAADLSAFGDGAFANVLAAAAESFSFADAAGALRALQPALETLGLDDAAEIVAFLIAPIERAQFAERIVLPLTGGVLEQSPDAGRFGEAATIAVTVPPGEAMKLAEFAGAPANLPNGEALGFAERASVRVTAMPYATEWS